jgi:hypothetical protein
MAEWEVKSPLDYSATGDDIDSASQKIIATFSDVYDKLNRLRSMDASADHSVGDAAAYSIKIDTSVKPAAILMRNDTNTGYIQIGSVADNLGITAADIGGVIGQGIGKLMLGADISKPASATTYDMYFAYDVGRLYMYRTGAWKVFLSLQFDDMQGVGDTVILRTEVAENGAGKIPRLNSVGEGNFDVTGSPGRIGGKEVFLPAVSDGQVLIYNAANDRWEAGTAHGEISEDDVSTTGEPNKIVKTDEVGKAHVDITGNAAKIAQKLINTRSLQDGDMLVYDANNGTFVNKQGAIAVDGTVEANITGSASKWCSKVLSTNNLQDGQVLAWSESLNAFVNINQSGLGNARMLVLKQNGVDVAEYNGSERVEMNFPAIIVGDTPPEGADMWVKPTDGESKDYVVVNLPSIVVSTEYPENAAVWIKPTDIGA